MSGDHISANGLPPRSYLVLAAMMWGLAACGGLAGPQAGASQSVELDGQTYRVEQLTDSTWTATPPAGLRHGALPAADLVRAIEKASACKVTDSSMGQQGAVLNAQVDCGSRLKN